MGEPNDRLFAYTDIGTEEARPIFHRLGCKAALAGLRRIPEGASTSNYVADLDDGQRFLLKLYPKGGGNGALEAAAYRYAAEFVKVPELYIYDDSFAVFHRPYAVMQFIDGVGLNQYVKKRSGLPADMARIIGCRLALLHGREYGRMALLDPSFREARALLPIAGLYAHYLNGGPGRLISGEVREDVLGYIEAHPELTERLAARSVFCHGDFSPGNMIVDGAGELWFIDFEYCMAAPPYIDIGKFFRDRPGVSDRPEVRAAFIEGYNSFAAVPLEEDWYALSRLMDMTSLLHLLTYESAAVWAGEIEREIGHTMRILREAFSIYKT